MHSNLNLMFSLLIYSIHTVFHKKQTVNYLVVRPRVSVFKSNKDCKWNHWKFSEVAINHRSRYVINPFSARCIVKFSQLEPIIFIDQLLENFTFNLQLFALFDRFSFSHYQMSYFVCYVRRSWVLITDWDWKPGLNKKTFECWVKYLRVLIKFTVWKVSRQVFLVNLFFVPKGPALE